MRSLIRAGSAALLLLLGAACDGETERVAVTPDTTAPTVTEVTPVPTRLPPSATPYSRESPTPTRVSLRIETGSLSQAAPFAGVFVVDLAKGEWTHLAEDPPQPPAG